MIDLSINLFEGGSLWGIKTLAMFDVWTIEHILSGISIGEAVVIHNRHHFKNIFEKIDSIFSSNHKTVIRFEIIGVLFLAYFWETIEHYLEIGLAGDSVAYWFQGVEFWANRIISDPLMLVIGYFIAKKYNFLVWPARILSIIWLIVHIFLFPHSMFLHDYF